MISLFWVLLLSPIAEGQSVLDNDTPNSKAQREAYKAFQVKEILSHHSMQLHPGIKTKNRSLCASFYQALLSASHTITYIEPLLRTDDTNHPGLEAYLKCDEYEPKEAFVYFDIRELGSRRFRLYRLDMDDNPKNGMEEYLYGQEPEYRFNTLPAQLIQVDFQKCVRVDGVPATPEEPGATGYGSTGINALVRYRGQYYFYDLERIGNGNNFSNLTLYSYDPRNRKFSVPMLCSWDVQLNK